MSLLQDHQRDGDVRMVRRGEVHALSWTEKKAIGTSMVSGIAVTIATDFAVILANIPLHASLLPENSLHAHAGENYIQSMMDRVHRFYHDSDYFPFPTEMQAVVCAWIHEDAPADEEQDVIDCLWEMGLEPVHMRRPILVNGTNGVTNCANGATNGATHTQSGEGECLVLRGIGGLPQIYVDDELVRWNRRELLRQN